MIKKLFKKLVKSEDSVIPASENKSEGIEASVKGASPCQNACDHKEKPKTAASQQEKTTTPAAKKEKSTLKTKDKINMNKIQHKYMEVSADLLAKPSALCDLAESQAGLATLVFCNNPSDADFVEVILKKRGISALKLIGFVAPEKLNATQEKVKNGEIGALVVTDVAARGADLSLFSSVINYSLPTDLDNYATRVGADQPGERTVFSIVGPLDFANLHSLKTQTNFELIQAEAPSKEQLANAKLLKLKNSAQAKFPTINPALVELARQIVADKDAEQIVAVLVQQSLEIVPQLQAQVEKLTWEKENQEEDDDFSQGQGNRRQGGRDNNRGGRNNRRDNRDSRDSYRQEGGRNRSDDYSDQSEGENQQFDSEEGSQQRNGRRRRDDWRPPPTKIRDDRLYIGKGQKDGFGKDDFLALLKEKCDLEADQLKRFLVRKNYCFADLPEAIAADVIAKLDGSESKAGNVYVAKATQVVTVIENQPEAQEASAEQEIADEQQASA